MPTIINETLRTSPLQVRSLLEEHTLQNGIFIDIDRCLDYVAHFSTITREKLRELRKVTNDPMFTPSSSQELIRKLLQMGAPEKVLIKRDASGRTSYSAGAPIRKALIEDPSTPQHLVDFLLNVNEWATSAKKISGLSQYLKLPLSLEESIDGHRMAIARPEWLVLNTGRIAARYPSIQNMDRLLGDIITHPKTHILVFADSGQIEPRIKYSWQIKDPVIKQLIILHKDAYKGILDYITLPSEVLEKFYQDPSKVVARDLDPGNRAQLKTILLAGAYGSSLPGVDPYLIKAFRDRITNHPLEIQLSKKIEDYINSGGTIAHTAFGNEIDPTANDNVDDEKRTPGTQKYFAHMRNAMLNNPMQGTAADLMNEAILNCHLTISREARGRTWIAYAKHDEGAFYVSNRDAHLVNKLGDFFGYEVTLKGEKWIPIEADITIGKKKGLSEIPEL